MCVSVFGHVRHGWSCSFPPSPLADGPSLCSLLPPLPPPASSSSCLFPWCQPWHARFCTLLLCFSWNCTVRLKIFCFLFSMYYLYERYYISITVQYYITCCVSWVSRLASFVGFNKLDLGTCSQNRTCSYVVDLFCCYLWILQLSSCNWVLVLYTIVVRKGAWCDLLRLVLCLIILTILENVEWALENSIDSFCCLWMKCSLHIC